MSADARGISGTAQASMKKGTAGHRLDIATILAFHGNPTNPDYGALTLLLLHHHHPPNVIPINTIPAITGPMITPRFAPEFEEEEFLLEGEEGEVMHWIAGQERQVL